MVTDNHVKLTQLNFMCTALTMTLNTFGGFAGELLSLMQNIYINMQKQRRLKPKTNRTHVKFSN